jgi:hypothetical protein
VQRNFAFTTPWTATMIYLRGGRELPEQVCAENTFEFPYDKHAVCGQAGFLNGREA